MSPVLKRYSWRVPSSGGSKPGGDGMPSLTRWESGTDRSEVCHSSPSKTSRVTRRMYSGTWRRGLVPQDGNVLRPGEVALQIDDRVVGVDRAPTALAGAAAAAEHALGQPWEQRRNGHRSCDGNRADSPAVPGERVGFRYPRVGRRRSGRAAPPDDPGPPLGHQHGEKTGRREHEPVPGQPVRDHRRRHGVHGTQRMPVSGARRRPTANRSTSRATRPAPPTSSSRIPRVTAIGAAYCRTAEIPSVKTMPIRRAHETVGTTPNHATSAATRTPSQRTRAVNWATITRGGGTPTRRRPSPTAATMAIAMAAGTSQSCSWVTGARVRTPRADASAPTTASRIRPVTPHRRGDRNRRPRRRLRGMPTGKHRAAPRWPQAGHFCSP